MTSKIQAALRQADREGRAVTDTRGAPSLKPHLPKGEQSMNTPGYAAAVLATAEAGGIHSADLAALRGRLQQLADPQAGLLPGEALEPLPDLPRLEELPEPPPGQARDVLGRLVIVKLNGGLGTSMGLAGPKSLLEVKPGANFLDVLARQVLARRERYRARLPLVLMNSAATSGPGASHPDRRADRLRPGQHLRPAAGPPAARPGRGGLPPRARRQAVGQERRPARAGCLPGLPAARRHPGRAWTGCPSRWPT